MLFFLRAITWSAAVVELFLKTIQSKLTAVTDDATVTAANVAVIAEVSVVSDAAIVVDTAVNADTAAVVTANTVVSAASGITGGSRAGRERPRTSGRIAEC